jgi:adenylylsulfate reductase subunit B
MIEKIDERKCNGCGICAEICPMDVLRLKTDIDIVSHSEKKGAFRQYKAYLAYPLDCMTCYLCELKCPTGAIDVGYKPLETPYIIS